MFARSIDVEMNVKRLFSMAASVCVSVAACAGDLCLDGLWSFRFEERKSLEEVARPDFEATDTITVPSCYDTLPKWLNKRGTGLYRRTFILERPVENAWLVIEGMGLRGDFRIDGKPLGVHPYPYARLELETGPLAAGEHEIFAALDNRFDYDKVPLVRPYYDFYCYGGFYQGVKLIFDNRRLFVRTRDYRTGSVEIEAVNFAESDFRGTLVFDGRNKVEAEFRNRRAKVSVPGFKLWSPDSPNLHTVALQDGSTAVRSRFGIRTVEARGARLWLNGKPLFLKGVNRHESHPVFGAATPDPVMLADIQNVKSLGANFIRGVHYQMCDRFLELCDENGILVWEESLGWGNGQPYTDGPRASRRNPPHDPLVNAEFFRQQVVQTREMVRASFNHPSVILYAFMNELGSDRSEARKLIEALCKAVRDEDSGRLVTFACNKPLVEICGDLLDVFSFNAYPGWISVEHPGDPDNLRRLVAEDKNRGIDVVTRHVRAKYPDKPVLVSEIGCCGVYGHHDPSAGQWTEEFQAEYYGDVIDVVFANPGLCGVALWQYADSKSYHRSWSVRVKPFAENLAGLYDGHRREKLAAKVIREGFSRKAAGESVE